MKESGNAGIVLQLCNPRTQEMWKQEGIYKIIKSFAFYIQWRDAEKFSLHFLYSVNELSANFRKNICLLGMLSMNMKKVSS